MDTFLVIIGLGWLVINVLMILLQVQKQSISKNMDIVGR